MTALQQTANAAALSKYRRFGLMSWVVNIALAGAWLGLFFLSDILTRRYFSNIYIQPADGIAILMLPTSAVLPMVSGPKRWTGLVMLAAVGVGIAGIAAIVNGIGRAWVGAFYLNVAFFAVIMGTFVLTMLVLVMRLLKSIVAPAEPKSSLAERWRNGHGSASLVVVVMALALACVVAFTALSSSAASITGVTPPYWPYGLCLLWGAFIGALAAVWGSIWAQPASK